MTTTTNTAAALQLAARPEGVTSAQLAEASGLAPNGAWKHLRRLEAAGLLVAEQHAERKGQPRGSWATVWRTVWQVSLAAVASPIAAYILPGSRVEYDAPTMRFVLLDGTTEVTWIAEELVSRDSRLMFRWLNELRYPGRAFCDVEVANGGPLTATAMTKGRKP